MRSHRILCIALTSTLMAAVTIGAPATAWADDDAAPVRKKVRVHLVRPKGAPAAAQKHDATPDPLDTVMRWAMGELGARAGKDGKGGDADATLRKWFEGGDDVPLAGLRDALKADGWTPQKLKAWGMSKAMQAGPQMMKLFADQAGPMGPGRFARRAPLHRSFTMMGPAAGHGEAGCPLCGEGRRGQSRGDQGRWGRRGGQGARRGPRWQRGRGAHGMGGGRMRGRGMRPQGPMHGDSQTVIFWNDGSGWRRQEIPGGMGHGQREHGRKGWGPMGQGRKGHGMGSAPGGAGMPPWVRQFMGGQHPPKNGPQGAGEMPWMKMLEGYMKSQGDGGGENDMAPLHELLQKLQKAQGEGGLDLQALLKHLQGSGGQHDARVKVVRPKPVEDGKPLEEDDPVK